MTLKDFQTLCNALPGTSAGFPFDESVLVCKVAGKMFALTNFNSFESISLKCDPDDAIALCGAFPAVRPGYHLNKRHWITVALDGTVPDALLRRWIRDSHTLVTEGMSGKKREALCSPALSTEKARAWIRENCGPLRSGLFDYHFAGGSPDSVMEALAEYQNPDGGFGGALEADFHLPDSTPAATSVAFGIMETVGGEESGMAEKGIRWLESVFDESRQGWFAAGPRVNDFPHAPWWHWNPQNGMTVIDHHWGNPSAEIIAILYRNRRYLRKLNADRLTEHAVGYLENLSIFHSPHEIYCFISLYDTLPREYRERMQEPLEKAAVSLMSTDPRSWSTYLPRPLDFASSPESGLFPAVADYAELHCRYLAETCEEGIWKPYWNWGGAYPEAWDVSSRAWTAALTTKNYLLLRNFAYPL